MSERASSHTLARPGEGWTERRGQRGGPTVCVRRLHMTSRLDEPSSLGRQWADSASFYSVRGLAMAASAFAITASARSIAARNSSLFQVSTCSPSSYDSSVASCARETNSRSAAMASERSLASASLREDCVTSLTPSHRNFGPHAISLQRTTIAIASGLMFVVGWGRRALSDRRFPRLSSSFRELSSWY